MIIDIPVDLFDHPITAADTTTGHSFGQQIDADDVRPYADGNWQTVIPAATGVDPTHFNGDEGPCPKCGGVDRWQMFDIEAGACRCRQCGVTTSDGFGTIQWLAGRTAAEFRDTVRQVAETVGYVPSSNGFIASVAKTKSKPPATKRKPAVLNDEIADLRDEIYTSAAEFFGLSVTDRAALKSRGMTDEEIDRGGYWSLPKRADRVLPMMKFRSRFLGRKSEIAANVPGIFPGGKLVIVGDASLMLPLRDLKGRVVGLRDHNPKRDPKYKWLSSKFAGGPSPGSPCHCPVIINGQDLSTIRVTEGELKSDIATAKTGVYTIAIPGVESWASCIPVLEHHRPKEIRIALDSDAATNKAVGRAVGKLWEHFTAAEWSPTVCVEIWDNGKGVDDAIVAGETIKALNFKQSAQYVDKVRGIDSLGDLLDDIQEHEEPHDPNRLARLNVARYDAKHGGRLAYWRGQWWKYRVGKWTRIDDETLDAKIRAGINLELMNIATAMNDIAEAKKDAQAKGDAAESKSEKIKAVKKKTSSNAMVKNVIGEMRSLCMLSPSVEMPTMLTEGINHSKFLSLENGLLDLAAVIGGTDPAEAFADHTADWFCGTKLEFAFDAAGECPTFDKYLRESLPDEPSRLLIQEYAGYLLETGNPFQRFLAVEGDGGTGKSVLLSGVLPALIGPQNVSHVKLDGFGGNQFVLSDTIGKALNVDADANQNAKFNEGLFKSFAVGERVQFELKGRDPISMRPTAKVALGWNTRPRIRDKSQGLWRRMLLVGFDHPVPEEKKIASMDTEQFWIQSGELPGIFNWAIDGLRRLHRQRGFTITEAMKTRIKEYRSDQDPLRSFFDDRLRYLPDDQTPTTTASVVAEFKIWCQENADAATAEKMNSRIMGKAIANHFGIESKMFPASLSDSKGKARGFFGLNFFDPGLEKDFSDSSNEKEKLF